MAVVVNFDIPLLILRVSTLDALVMLNNPHIRTLQLTIESQQLLCSDLPVRIVLHILDTYAYTLYLTIANSI